MSKNNLAYTNCNIVCVRDGSLIHNATIITNGEKIIDLGNLEIPSLNNLCVFDMNQSWVIPGLIDLHVHVCDEPNPKLSIDFQKRESEILSGIRASKNLNEALYSGITTLRDAGSYDGRNIHIKNAIRKRIIDGPDLWSCGYLITYPKGHFKEIGIEVRGVESVRNAVKFNLNLGADYIKVTNDPEDDEAKCQPSDPTLTKEEFACLVNEAHENGMKVACHTYPSLKGINNALNAGVDTFEHAAPLTDEILESFLKLGSIVVPTFVASCDEFPLKMVVKRIGANYGRSQKYYATNDPLPPHDVKESLRIWFDLLTKYLPSAIKNGVNIGIGSDAGCIGTNFKSAIREMFLLTQLGATNLQVLQYATINGAKALGVDTLGVIESGSLANLVFLRDNPIENLDTLLDKKTVVNKGTIVTKN